MYVAPSSSHSSSFPALVLQSSRSSFCCLVCPLRRQVGHCTGSWIRKLCPAQRNSSYVFLMLSHLPLPLSTAQGPSNQNSFLYDHDSAHLKRTCGNKPQVRNDFKQNSWRSNLDIQPVFYLI